MIPSSRIPTTALISGLLLLSATAAQAEHQPILPLDAQQQSRLGIEFASASEPQHLTTQTLPGISRIRPDQEVQLTLPFEVRIEAWQSAPGSHIERDRQLVSLHSHDASAFFRENCRLASQSGLCQQRLATLQQRQKSGMSTRLEVEEKALECQQLTDDIAIRQQQLEHLPADWANRTSSELPLQSPGSGWLIGQTPASGTLIPAHQPLVRFWPDDALRVEIRVPAGIYHRLNNTATLQGRSRENPDQPRSFGIASQAMYPDAQGLYSVWLQPTGLDHLVPGQRWQVEIPSAQSGWVIPASARIRANGESWIFVRQQQGDQQKVVPTRIEPIAEGQGQLLLDQQDFPQAPELAIKGTAALTSWWMASSEGE